MIITGSAHDRCFLSPSTTAPVMDKTGYLVKAFARCYCIFYRNHIVRFFQFSISSQHHFYHTTSIKGSLYGCQICSQVVAAYI
ncbi:hypothetical protein C5167_007877 [Papaver somniferum]|nr:hypothetical protein C5167_007877 [Papaver somniferum]